MEPAIRLNSGSCGFRFFVIAFCDRLTPKQDFIVFTDFHFNPRQYNTYRTDIIANRQCTRYSSRRFRQSISYHHIDSYRMDKFIDFIGDGSTGSREKVTILNTDCFFQQRIDSLLVKLIFQLIHHRRSLSQTQIIQIMDSTYPDSIQHQCLLQPGCFVYFFLYPCIHLLPKTGNTAHQCRANFLNGCLYICRTEIDTNLHSFMNTEITPCFLKHVC